MAKRSRNTNKASMRPSPAASSKSDSGRATPSSTTVNSLTASVPKLKVSKLKPTTTVTSLTASLGSLDLSIANMAQHNSNPANVVKPTPTLRSSPASSESGGVANTPASTNGETITGSEKHNSVFFSTFGDFHPKANQNDAVNFGRLAFQRKWRLNSKIWRRHWRTCFSSDFQPEQNPYALRYFDFFFKCFPGFKADATASISVEFDRLGTFMGWKRGSKEWLVYQKQAYEAEFVEAYGGSAAEDKLANWQALCAEVGVEPVPQSITQCRKALARVNVNICDLLDCRRSGKKVRLFRTKWALIHYTRSIGKKKMFPKEAAKEDGFLKALLKKMF